MNGTRRLARGTPGIVHLLAASSLGRMPLARSQPAALTNSANRRYGTARRVPGVPRPKTVLLFNVPRTLRSRGWRDRAGGGGVPLPLDHIAEHHLLALEPEPARLVAAREAQRR